MLLLWGSGAMPPGNINMKLCTPDHEIKTESSYHENYEAVKPMMGDIANLSTSPRSVPAAV